MNENDFSFSKHLKERIRERNLDKAWIVGTIKSPDKTVLKSKEETHFFRKIVEFSGKCLKVVFNPIKKLVITAHFDRKMTKKSCK